MALVFAFVFPKIPFGWQCAILDMPISIIGFLYVAKSTALDTVSLTGSHSAPPIIFETLLFVLTMAKFYEALRDGWGHEPVMSRFLKDGIWVFALPFSMYFVRFTFFFLQSYLTDLLSSRNAVCLTVNTCCLVLLDNSISGVVFPCGVFTVGTPAALADLSLLYRWVIAIPGITVSSIQQLSHPPL